MSTHKRLLRLSDAMRAARVGAFESVSSLGRWPRVQSVQSARLREVASQCREDAALLLEIAGELESDAEGLE